MKHTSRQLGQCSWNRLDQEHCRACILFQLGFVRFLRSVVKFFLEKQSYCHGIVMFSVMRTVEQGEVPLSCHIQEGSPGFAVGLQFNIVTTTKLIPFDRVMPEPLTQCSAGRDLFQPSIHREVLFFQSTRPEPINQKARSIVRLILVIYTFDSYHDSLPLPQFNGKPVCVMYLGPLRFPQVHGSPGNCHSLPG